MKKYTAGILALNIWLMTGILFTVAGFCFEILPLTKIVNIALVFIVLLLSFPVLIILLIVVPLIRKFLPNYERRLTALLIIEVIVITPYAFLAGMFDIFHLDELTSGLLALITLTACSFISTFYFSSYVKGYFLASNKIFAPDIIFQTSIKHTTMEAVQDFPAKSQSNKILFKGLIAGGLVLIMLIPTLIVQNLVEEREARQKEVVKEVSAKWATSQTLAGPFLMIPYTESVIDKEGKPVFVKKELVILSQKMNVRGEITPVSRPRSIYKVLLYKSNIDIAGSFNPNWPSGIDTSRLDFAKAKLCFGISDFKGIEEEIAINFNNKALSLSPGLPENNISRTGLSVPVMMTQATLQAGMDYKLNVKLKGSEKLHFMPLSANSSFTLKSSWPNPSFDGNALPNERSIHTNGFDAKWNYNQANLPFGTVLKNEVAVNDDISFGVSMVQPADQYNKTMRSIKYAILIIGLTFALFFIIEIMQGKPFHPVQYVLVGLALVIFYTLLLAISEYILFDYAYPLAAGATILLVALYAKSHFQSWKTAGIFAAVLSMLYGFIFILLRLEDTALLVGSIGLFIVLALVMYVSRKVNWYGTGGMQVEG